MANENHDKVESMFVIKITFLAVILSSFIYYIFIYILPFLFAFFFGFNYIGNILWKI